MRDIAILFWIMLQQLSPSIPAVQLLMDSEMAYILHDLQGVLGS